MHEMVRNLAIQCSTCEWLIKSLDKNLIEIRATVCTWNYGWTFKCKHLSKHSYGGRMNLVNFLIFPEIHKVQDRWCCEHHWEEYTENLTENIHHPSDPRNFAANLGRLPMCQLQAVHSNHHCRCNFVSSISQSLPILYHTDSCMRMPYDRLMKCPTLSDKNKIEWYECIVCLLNGGVLPARYRSCHCRALEMQTELEGAGPLFEPRRWCIVIAREIFRN